MKLASALFAVALLAQQDPPDLGYRALPDWPQLPAGWNFKETPGIAAGPQGNVFVIHRGDHPVMEFDRDGKFLRAFGDGLYERPHAVRLDPEGNIWTVDDLGHTVIKMDPKGRVRMVLGRWKQPSDAPAVVRSTSPRASGVRDEGIVRFNRPTDVAFAPNGDIYVSDGYGNSRVVKFAKDGRFLKEWGRRGDANGEFNTPHAIAVDKQSRVYVADRENYRVQIFDADGKYLDQWTHVGAPWGLAVASDQSLYMSDGYNNLVLKLSLDGKIQGSLGSPGKLPGQFTYVHHLSVGPDGSIYTAEILNWRPQKFVKK